MESKAYPNIDGVHIAHSMDIPLPHSPGMNCAYKPDRIRINWIYCLEEQFDDKRENINQLAIICLVGPIASIVFALLLEFYMLL